MDMAIKDILQDEPSDELPSLRYNDKQIQIIKSALQMPDSSVADLYRHLEENVEDPPSQGYIYNVLKRTSKDGYETSGEESGEDAPVTQESSDEMDSSEEEQNDSDEAAIVTERQSGMISISITIPEDSDFQINVKENEDDEEEPVLVSG